MKLTISLDEDLVRRLDDEADSCYLSRSSVITLACTQYLDQKLALNALIDVSIAMNKIAESGTIDDDSKKKLADFEKLVMVMTGGEVGKR